jgi:hypothetical protein
MQVPVCRSWSIGTEQRGTEQRGTGAAAKGVGGNPTGFSGFLDKSDLMGHCVPMIGCVCMYNQWFWAHSSVFLGGNIC